MASRPLRAAKRLPKFQQTSPHILEAWVKPMNEQAHMRMSLEMHQDPLVEEQAVYSLRMHPAILVMEEWVINRM